MGRGMRSGLIRTQPSGPILTSPFDARYGDDHNGSGLFSVIVLSSGCLAAADRVKPIGITSTVTVQHALRRARYDWEVS